MNKDILNDLITYLESLHHIKADDIPDLDLYMDQVTGFMDDHLAKVKRHPEDKALTKTMINNYAKNHLLPAPVKKRYSREHILILLFIYYYKGVLNLTDIQTILEPINQKYFSNDKDLSLEDIYETVFSLEDKRMSHLIDDVTDKFETASLMFPEDNDTSESLSPEDRDELRMFAFLGELGFDVYLKRQLMERIIDQIRASQKDKEMKESAQKRAVKKK
jgi:hypothetical protein